MSAGSDALGLVGSRFSRDPGQLALAPGSSGWKLDDGKIGRAWISADKFQIIRIESELVRPLPDIYLRSEHQITEYGPVTFGAKKMQLWLPTQAEVYLDFRKRLYYRKHSFDHFMLFSVDAQDTLQADKHTAHSPN
ncbi:MAG: hypothetical protein H0X25_18185 [Acidobacteriales bacterium]|nr:hypothetical protein [Terriglobales bacterium]